MRENIHFIAPFPSYTTPLPTISASAPIRRQENKLKTFIVTEVPVQKKLFDSIILHSNICNINLSGKFKKQHENIQKQFKELSKRSELGEEIIGYEEVLADVDFGFGKQYGEAKDLLDGKAQQLKQQCLKLNENCDKMAQKIAQQKRRAAKTYWRARTFSRKPLRN